MEAETKNNTSEIAQITFKLTQDERQIIEESSNAAKRHILSAFLVRKLSNSFS